MLARLQRLVEEAQREKAPLQRLADRISGVFVPIVLAGAAATSLIWWLAVGNAGEAVLSGVAVLLVACPCAMGLATPVAMMVGCGRASTLGILVRGSDALERLARAEIVAFDKTGTLTERRAAVTAVIPAEGVSESELVDVAAAVESESEHPIASAIRQAATGSLSASEVHDVPGKGVSGVVGGCVVSVGRFEEGGAEQRVDEAARERLARGETVVAVDRDGRLIGAIAVSTPLRPEAIDAMAQLRRLGVRTAVLSGDSKPAVDVVAAALGITDARSALSPAGKLESLRDLRQRDRHLMMVGDGINDAPALAAADVGCAIGSGTEAALANSDVALIGNDLRGVPAAIALARATRGVIIQNFGWAMGYNISALPLAALGLLDPLVAALAMGLSSLVVVLNSLRLLRLGRNGLAGVRAPRSSGRRAFVLSVAVPVVVFAAATGIGQVVSPARGQSLLGTVVTPIRIAIGHGDEADVYFGSARAGVNQFHLVLVLSGGQRVDGPPEVWASTPHTAPQLVRQLALSPEHYEGFVNLSPGSWTFRVRVALGGKQVSFRITRTFS